MAVNRMYPTTVLEQDTLGKIPEIGDFKTTLFVKIWSRTIVFGISEYLIYFLRKLCVFPLEEKAL